MDCSLSRDSPGKNTGVKVAMPSPGDLPDLGMELASLKSPALGDGSLPLEPTLGSFPLWEAHSRADNHTISGEG